MIKEADLNKLQDFKDHLEAKKNNKKRAKQELLDIESLQDIKDLGDYNDGDINLDQDAGRGPEIVIPQEPKEKANKRTKLKQTTEDKLKVLLDAQYDRIEKMIGEKLEHSQYRIYRSFEAELRRWFEGYYDQFTKGKGVI